MSTDYIKASAMASAADVPIIRTFPKLWNERKWIGKHPILVINNVGFIAWAPKSFGGKVYNKVYYLYILPSQRRKGHATKLLDSVPGEVLYVTKADNKEAQEFILSEGYSSFGSQPNEFGGVDYYYTSEPDTTDTTDTTANNGGPTHYYDFEEGWKEAGDVIEGRGMNFNQGSMFKVAFCFNIGRHSATNYERELNKLIYFAERELERIKNGN